MFFHLLRFGTCRRFRCYLACLPVVALLIVAGTPEYAARQKLPVAVRSWAIPGPWTGAAPLLTDVSQSGLLLFNMAGQILPSGEYFNPNKLFFFQIGNVHPTFDIPLPEVEVYAKKQGGSFRYVRPGPFRFSKDGKSIIGVQIPWLVLTDIATGNEVHRVRPCERTLLGGSGRTGLPLPLPMPPLSERLQMAINPSSGSVAASCVVNDGSEIAILDDHLEKNPSSLDSRPTH